MTSLASRLAEVDERIAAAARSAGRSPAELTRIVVTKFHPASLVAELHALGVRDVGENRQQELTAKRAELDGLSGLRWHAIGQVQTKKARAVRRAADAVHSVDRVRLVDALERAAESGDAPLDVFAQVNLTDDPGRGGAAPADLEALAEAIVSSPSLRLVGTMAVAPLEEHPAVAFERLAAHAARVRSIAPDAAAISAGMSHDFAEAVAAGATHLRIGTAITGQRPSRD
ncbi:YggS family pyridoxal phosphate-dependent enzyme [Microbacterium sp. gxy059]|uniref:YggS family pyridoxal phosphate-dependent enzyme n=1 Tax=Microbacterium sp. gxy059 TaxID=2957199 RepID=UPI003D999693